MSLPLNKKLLEQFPNKVFVETGSYRGDAIQQALDAGFEKIISMDIDLMNLKFCISRFNLSNVEMPIELHCGDSATELWKMIEKVDVPITFWLDAHWQMLEGTSGGKNPFPLLKELEQIERHPIKTHTILIDDWHIFYKDLVGYTKVDVEIAIKKINPRYKFSYLANPVIDGILVATV